MDNLFDKTISDGNRVGPFSTVLHRLLDIVQRLTGFFTLTEEEQKQAGISLSADKHDG